MAFKDILLQLTSYPEPTPVAALDQAVAFAAASGARITALAFEIVVNVPGTVLAPALLDVRGLIAAEQRRSAANARALIETFASAAERRGVAHEHFIESSENSQVPEIVTEYARLSDVTMIPVGHEASFQQFIAETVIFGSGGRPSFFRRRRSAGATRGFRPGRDRLGFQPAGGARGGRRHAPVAGREWCGWSPSRKKSRSKRVGRSPNSRGILRCTASRPQRTRSAPPGRSVGQVLEGYATARELDLL